MRLFSTIVTFFLLAILAFAEEKTDWLKYSNERFGFVLNYPKGLFAGKEPSNGGGREFHSSNEEFSVAAFAHFFVPGTEDSFDARWQEELKTPNIRITYQKKTALWYVVSGIARNGTEFYHKLYRKDANWVAFHITYPHAKHEIYDPWVAQIEKTFVPFPKGDFDRLE